MDPGNLQLLLAGTKALQDLGNVNSNRETRAQMIRVSPWLNVSGIMPKHLSADPLGTSMQGLMSKISMDQNEKDRQDKEEMNQLMRLQMMDSANRMADKRAARVAAGNQYGMGQSPTPGLTPQLGVNTDYKPDFKSVWDAINLKNN